MTSDSTDDINNKHADMHRLPKGPSESLQCAIIKIQQIFWVAVVLAMSLPAPS